MKIAVISDIHGNFEALKEVLKDAEKNGVTKFFCLGDIVGYGLIYTSVLEKSSVLGQSPYPETTNTRCWVS